MARQTTPVLCVRLPRPRAPTLTPTAQPIPATTYIYDIEHGPAGWTGTGLWHITSRRGAIESQHSWWYGQEITGTYDTGARTTGPLTSPPLLLESYGVPELGVCVWWSIESVNPRACDQMILQISNDDGATWHTLMTFNLQSNPVNGASQLPYTSGGFNQPGEWICVFPIILEGYAREVVQLRFVFDSVDDTENTFEGLYGVE